MTNEGKSSWKILQCGKPIKEGRIPITAAVITDPLKAWTDLKGSYTYCSVIYLFIRFCKDTHCNRKNRRYICLPKLKINLKIISIFLKIMLFICDRLNKILSEYIWIYVAIPEKLFIQLFPENAHCSTRDLSVCILCSVFITTYTIQWFMIEIYIIDWSKQNLK